MTVGKNCLQQCKHRIQGEQITPHLDSSFGVGLKQTFQGPRYGVFVPVPVRGTGSFE